MKIIFLEKLIAHISKIQNYYMGKSTKIYQRKEKLKWTSNYK